MEQIDTTWLPLDVAATQWGYTVEGLRRRLRQLRTLGYVQDTGRVPHGYDKNPVMTDMPIALMWVNATTVLIRRDASKELLAPKRGKRIATPPATKR